MQLTHTFTVALPVADAWTTLTDLERVAPCLPGAALTGRDLDSYQGIVKVKVGPVGMQYQGTARFLEKNEVTRCAVIRAEGKDAKGQGTAVATITANLTPRGDATEVSVLTVLEISGRVAQFGRGVIADVSSKMLTEFVERLEQDLSASEPNRPPAAGGVPAPRPLQVIASPSSTSIPSADHVVPIDLAQVIPRAAVVKMAAVTLGVLVLVAGSLGVGRWLERRTSQPRARGRRLDGRQVLFLTSENCASARPVSDPQAAVDLLTRRSGDAMSFGSKTQNLRTVK